MKTLLRMLSVFMVAVLMLCTLSVVGVSAETYIIDEGYKFTRDTSSVTICEYQGTEPYVTLPSTLVGLPVVNVGEYAFMRNNVIKSMTMPISISTIERGAFFECTSLESVALPKNCTQAGAYLFYGCTSLVTVNMPDILEEVPRYCFSFCSALETVVLPSTAKVIGDYAFANCAELQHVFVSKYTTYISDTAFNNSPKAVIYGYLDTYAYTYAMENSIPFTAMDAPADTLSVTFFDAEGAVYRDIPVLKGGSVIAPTDYPTKAATDTHYYEFAYWEGNTTNVQENEFVYPVYYEYEIVDENEPNTYTVVFLDGDGKFMEMQTVEKGGSAVAPEETPNKESTTMLNYTFSCWDTDFSVVTENLVVRPVFTGTIREFTVKFIDMYGEVIDSQRVKYGEDAVEPEVPEVEGYKFVGWNGSNVFITDHTTITALYEKIPDPEIYTVVFVDGNGYVMDVQSVTEGESATAPSEAPPKDPTEEYVYIFTGWAGDVSCITESVVLRPIYTEKKRTYKVVFLDIDGNVLHEQSAYYGDRATAPTPPTIEGYAFSGWDADYTFIKSDLVINARYVEVKEPATSPTIGKLRVEVTGGTGFSISVDGEAARPQGASYVNTRTPVGAEVSVVANDSAGNKFIGWMNESGAIVSTTESYTFITTANDYLKAVYMTDIEGVNSVVFKNGKAAGGRGQIIDMQYYSSADEVHFIDDPTQPGYEFLGWNLSAGDIAELLDAGQDVTVLANWEAAKVYVDVIVWNGTVTSGASYDEQYLAYSAVTVTADPAPEGKRFAYWIDLEGNVVSYDAEYKFYPTGYTELTAEYFNEDEEIAFDPLVFIAADPSTAGEKITYTLSWDIDETVGTVTSAGLMVVNNDDFDPETFYHGTTDTNVFDRALSSSEIKQQNIYTITKGSSYADNTYVACTFVVYTSAETGESETCYSSQVYVYKETV